MVVGKHGARVRQCRFVRGSSVRHGDMMAVSPDGECVPIIGAGALLGDCEWEIGFADRRAKPGPGVVLDLVMAEADFAVMPSPFSPRGGDR